MFGEQAKWSNSFDRNSALCHLPNPHVSITVLTRGPTRYAHWGAQKFEIENAIFQSKVHGLKFDGGYIKPESHVI